MPLTEQVDEDTDVMFNLLQFMKPHHNFNVIFIS